MNKKSEAADGWAAEGAVHRAQWAVQERPQGLVALARAVNTSSRSQTLELKQRQQEQTVLYQRSGWEEEGTRCYERGSMQGDSSGMSKA